MIPCLSRFNQRNMESHSRDRKRHEAQQKNEHGKDRKRYSGFPERLLVDHWRVPDPQQKQQHQSPQKIDWWLIEIERAPPSSLHGGGIAEIHCEYGPADPVHTLTASSCPTGKRFNAGDKQRSGRPSRSGSIDPLDTPEGRCDYEKQWVRNWMPPVRAAVSTGAAPWRTPADDRAVPQKKTRNRPAIPRFKQRDATERRFDLMTHRKVTNRGDGRRRGYEERRVAELPSLQRSVPSSCAPE